MVKKKPGEQKKKKSSKKEILKPSPQYQKSHQNMLIIPPNAGHGFAALVVNTDDWAERAVGATNPIGLNPFD